MWWPILLHHIFLIDQEATLEDSNIPLDTVPFLKFVVLLHWHRGRCTCSAITLSLISRQNDRKVSGASTRSKINCSNSLFQNASFQESYSGQTFFDIPKNYMSLLFSIALIIASSLECICAALASYKSSRDLCPCFKRNEENYNDNINIHRSHAIVSSWLGKQNPPPQIYVVAGPPSSLGGRSKVSDVDILFPSLNHY